MQAGSTQVATRRAALRKRRRREGLRTFAFLSPWLTGVGLLVAYPLAATVYFSFTSYDQINPPKFVGMRNWKYVFTQYPPFWQALRNTLWLVVVMVTLRVIFGLGIGMLAVALKTGAKVFRTVLYLPVLVPPVAATIGFVFLLNPSTGPVSAVFGWAGFTAPAMFADPMWAKPALTLLALWGVGDLMVIFMAALLDVPVSLYEAAGLDGANRRQRFRYITLPTISPVVLFAVITGVIATMQYYTQAIVAGKLASGANAGPGGSFQPGFPEGSTLTVPQLVYSLGFQNFNVGAASVLALVLFILSMAITGPLLSRRLGFITAEDSR